MKAKKAIAATLIVATLVPTFIGCKEINRKNAIAKRYDVTLDSLHKVRDRKDAQRLEDFNSTADHLLKLVRADSALMASGKATAQDSFNVSFNGALLYPTMLRELQIEDAGKTAEIREIDQKIDTIQKIRDSLSWSAYSAKNSIVNTIVAGFMALVVVGAITAALLTYYWENIKAGWNRAFRRKEPGNTDGANSPQ